MSTRRRRPVKKINKNMKKKLAVLFSLVVLALVGLVARITYINATSGSKYRNMKIRHSPPKGEIFMTGMEIFWQQVIKFIM